MDHFPLTSVVSFKINHKISIHKCCNQLLLFMVLSYQPKHVGQKNKYDQMDVNK